MLRFRSNLRYGRGRTIFGRADGSSAGQEPAPAPLRTGPIQAGQRLSEQEADQVADLLNHQPAQTVPESQLRWALSFAFSGGDAASEIFAAKRTAPVADSDFEPEVFASDLFIDALIEQCLAFKLGDFQPQIDQLHMKRLLTQPPRSRADLLHRQAILKELTDNAALREQFERTYRSLHALRALFDCQDIVDDWDDKRRRLDLLVTLRKVVEGLEGFHEAKSGLKRLFALGCHVRSLPGFVRLCELLDYENHLATADLRVRIGADGRVRHFEIVGIQESRDSRFYRSPAGRLWARIRLLLRGYSVSHSEVVDRWLDSVFEGVLAPLPGMIGLISDMEFFLAGLWFRDLAQRKNLAVSFGELTEPDAADCPGRRLTGLFNPLLLSHDQRPISCDLSTESCGAITIVTGPNSGGKTRLLQALAFAQLMGQSGLYVAAARAQLCWANGLFVSLIEAARADQREGRLGTEMLRIRLLFEHAKPNSLVVLDELCSGTNPSEGEEIFRLVVSLLHELSPSAFITTHFLEFASRLEREAGRPSLSFLQVQLDDRELPTFQFVPGVARTSLAHQTAARLGVTRDELLALIRRHERSGRRAP